MILLVPACTVRRPIQLVISLRALNRLSVEILKHTLSDLVRRELNEAVADRTAIQFVPDELNLLNDGELEQE